MQNFFVKIQHDDGFDYLKTTAFDRESLLKSLPNTLNCPPSAIKQVVQVFSHEFETLPASTIATASGLFKLVINKLNCERGAPMGRGNVTDCEIEGYYNGSTIYNTGRLYDRKVQLDSGAYDKGGAYWGFPNDLHVTYNKYLTYVCFYRR